MKASLREAIQDLWLAMNPDVETRTRERHQDHVRRMLITAGKSPTRAEYDAAGNCTTCGEAGRCWGWHYTEEEL